MVKHSGTKSADSRMTGDSPLLPEALVEIAALGDYLSDIQFDAIFQVLQNVRLIQQRFYQSIIISHRILSKKPSYSNGISVFLRAC
jgi:broad specificity phosphatase PhoE